MKFSTLVQSAFVLCFSVSVTAQSYTAKVVHHATNEIIPFATVQYAENQGTITNEEGVFAIPLDRVTDSITISSMGFEPLSIFPQKATDTILKLKVATNELNMVFLSNKNLSPEEIIERVKENLATNYPDQLQEQKIFYRNSSRSLVDKLDIDFKKSTIEELNKKLLDSILEAVPRRSDYYTEAVATTSGNFKEQKLRIAKSANLYDENNTVSIDGFGDKLERIFKENVKPNSYLKIKSGWFGKKVQLEEGTEDGQIVVNLGDEEKETEKVQDTASNRWDETQAITWQIENMYKNIFFDEDSKLDFLEKSNRYEFESDGFTTIDGEAVYKLTFTPKGRKDFSGKLYINAQDYGVMRLEYQNVRNLRNIKLLGISYKEHVYRGKTIFTKNDAGAYTLRYIEKEEGTRVGVDRPLKVIEKNKFVKGKRKQNELSLGLDVAISEVNRTEMVIFDSATIDQATYDSTEPSKDIKSTHLTAYDPTFWEGYDIMEPNAAIQSFKSLEE